MIQKTYQLALITENQAVAQQISSFCEKLLPTNAYQLTTQNTFSDLNGADVILIGADKIVIFLKEYSMTDIKLPLICLYEGNYPRHLDAFDDSIDLGHATPIGFSRAILSTIEKYAIRLELAEQKSLLRKLSASLEVRSNSNEINPISQFNEAGVNAHDLLKENKVLIDKVQAQNEQLQQLAKMDMLTAVGNRISFEETLIRMIAHAKRHAHLLALLIMDLDKFKDVNDTYGHQTGDLLLQQVAKRLESTLRKSDFIFRIGGDEFAILLNEIKNTHVAGIVAAKAIEAVNKPYDLNGIQVTINISIGIACYPVVGESVKALVKHADIAMYRVKKSHELQYAFATEEMQQDHMKRVGIEHALQEAISHDEFHMVYQPIYELSSRKLHGFEALLRWNNKVLGNVSPDEFIPIAEESGIIYPITQWTLDAVCKQIAHWQQSISFPYKISVNLSPIQLTQEDLLRDINTIVKQHNIPYELLEFEITEMSIMKESKQSVSTMEDLYKFGASHALDDFGTGYSSIVHLKYLPIATIKIDRSFVTGLGKEKKDRDIVSSIIALAKKLGLKVVAEGIETKMQLETLEKEGCDYVQGFYFSKPLTSEKVEEIIINK